MRRVVVTGMGIVSCIGDNLLEHKVSASLYYFLYPLVVGLFARSD